MLFGTNVPNSRLLAIAILISVGTSFHFGYQLVITNPTQTTFLNFVNESLDRHYHSRPHDATLKLIWGIIVALFTLGYMIGTALLPTIADKFGRKRGLYISAFINIIGCLSAAASKWSISFEMYSVSRLLFGVSLGIGLGLSTVYLTEISPRQCRGFMNSLTGVMIANGVLIGSIIAMPTVLGDAADWPYIYIFELALALVFIIMLPLIDDSPAHLTMIGDELRARAVIRRNHRCTDDETSDVIAEIRQTIIDNSNSLSLIEVWRNRESRRGTLIGCLVSTATIFAGISVITAFAVQLFTDNGLVEPWASIANVLLAIISVFASITSSLIVDRVGRRPLLLWTNLSLVVLNMTIFGLMLAHQSFPSSKLLGYTIVAVVAGCIILFNIGIGQICFFITIEMVSQNARSASQSWTLQMLSISRIFVLITYLPINDLIGAYSYLLFFVPILLVSTCVLYFYLPETKNRNLAQVQLSIAHLPKLRNCRFYNVANKK